MTLRSAIAAIGVLFVCSGQLGAADLPARPIKGPVPPPTKESGIWAAIAYASANEKHGFFWGADKRQEAADLALEHCRRAGGDDCVVVSVFRNHRHWDDDDRTGFPYHHCGALAVAQEPAVAQESAVAQKSAVAQEFAMAKGKGDRITSDRVRPWSAKAAPTRREAEDQAVQACERTGTQCAVREWVCT
ncbi:DUF4189 domain-containing protein [Bosea vaviloviae]|uniref:DUF4189 domain-containing protein n=1 Tax=Bosea vaviloviae TaxID=1526658 RepID=A0A1D7U490_9HYPH|nr:DUF4189 domain-containing protein [Bosea vaviloviae]AOO82193.1 hypothetical protein BHK69_18670 [Bosea vaviloviae]